MALCPTQGGQRLNRQPGTESAISRVHPGDQGMAAAHYAEPGAPDPKAEAASCAGTARIRCRAGRDPGQARMGWRLAAGLYRTVDSIRLRVGAGDHDAAGRNSAPDLAACASRQAVRPPAENQEWDTTRCAPIVAGDGADPRLEGTREG